MDQVELRYDLFEQFDIWKDVYGFQDDTIDQLKSIVMDLRGNKLYVLYLKLRDNLNQKEIAEAVGITPAAVCKMFKHDKDYARIWALLLFKIEQAGGGLYNEKATREARTGNARAPNFDNTMSPSEIALSAALANDLIYSDQDDDYSDGNPGRLIGRETPTQSGSISGRFGGGGGDGWSVGMTDDPYSRKHSETLQIDALKKYHAELKEIEKK